MGVPPQKKHDFFNLSGTPPSRREDELIAPLPHVVGTPTYMRKGGDLERPSLHKKFCPTDWDHRGGV